MFGCFFKGHDYKFMTQYQKEIFDYDIERQFHRSYGTHTVKLYVCEKCGIEKEKVI